VNALTSGSCYAEGIPEVLVEAELEEEVVATEEVALSE
jgi:hypothetical protein